MRHNSVAKDRTSGDSSHWAAGHSTPIEGVGLAAVLAQVSGPRAIQSRLALDTALASELVAALRSAADAADAGAGFTDEREVTEVTWRPGATSKWAVRATGGREVAVRFRDRHGDEDEAVMDTDHARDFADDLEEKAAVVAAALEQAAAPGPR